MKKSHYLRLLAYEPGFLLGILLYGAFCTCSSIFNFLQDEAFYLGFLPEGVFAVVLIGMAFLFLFKVPLIGAGTKGRQPALSSGELEFFFTRAISRRSIYWAKTTRYLLACLFPFLITWAYSSSKPLIRVEAPNINKEASMEQYYLSHFQDSHIQAVPVDGKPTNYVILPHGQMNRTFFTLAWVCFAALLLQFTIFLFWDKSRVMIAIWFAFVALPGFIFLLLTFSTASSILDETPLFVPTFYEAAMAWVTQHTAPTLLALGLLAIVVQTYCCRRYINTEIIP
jgi:hypothetical protein